MQPFSDAGIPLTSTVVQCPTSWGSEYSQLFESSENIGRGNCLVSLSQRRNTLGILKSGRVLIQGYCCGIVVWYCCRGYGVSL